jgi:hypothetical protein
LLHVGSGNESSAATNPGALKVHTSGTKLESVGGIELPVAADGYSVKIQGVSDSGAALVFANRADSATWTERMRINANGNVGIGTTSPNERFTVGGSGTFGMGFQQDSTTIAAIKPDTSTGEVQHFATTDYFPTFYSNGAERMRINAAGNVGIGVSAPTSQLHTSGTVRFAGFGAGTLVTDSSGNVTASSDASLKTVTGSFTRGLADVLKLTPRTYHWNEKSGMNTEDENVGFIAQEVLDAVPEAVGQYRTTEMEIDGKKTKKREKSEFLTLSDRPLIAALVNAVKELKAENDALLARVSALENGKAAK